MGCLWIEPTEISGLGEKLLQLTKRECYKEEGILHLRNFKCHSWTLFWNSVCKPFLSKSEVEPILVVSYFHPKSSMVQALDMGYLVPWKVVCRYLSCHQSLGHLVSDRSWMRAILDLDNWSERWWGLKNWNSYCGLRTNNPTCKKWILQDSGDVKEKDKEGEDVPMAEP